MLLIIGKFLLILPRLNFCFFVFHSNHRRLFGNHSEDIAAEFLTTSGFLILHRNYRIRGGEIDLIALEENVLCFIEVRSRQSNRFGHAIETISTEKQRHITKTAEHFLAYTWQKPVCSCRFDVVIVEGLQQKVTLIRNAF